MMFGLMRVSTHKRLMAEQRNWHTRLNVDTWKIVVRMIHEVRGAQKGLMRLQRKLKRTQADRIAAVLADGGEKG